METSLNDVNVTRFSVENGSHLVIINVSLTDHGIYLCTEDDGFGAKHPVFLFVLEDGIICLRLNAAKRINCFHFNFRRMLVAITLISVVFLLFVFIV